VVASDIPALREVAGEGALLLSPTDFEGWAACVARICAAPETLDELRDRGTRQVRRFSWERTALGVCAVFAELAAGKRH
jgi:glycosyltransferase involved in cell wall biosynthesis